MKKLLQGHRAILSYLGLKFPQIQSQKGNFLLSGPGKGHGTLKSSRPPWLADNKNFRILYALEWLKQYYFDLGDSLLIVSALVSV